MSIALGFFFNRLLLTFNSEVQPINRQDKPTFAQLVASTSGAERLRGWAITPGAPLNDIAPWRWRSIDPGCVVKRSAAAARDAEVLPETWAAFQSSERRIVFPPPVTARKVNAGADVPALSVITIMRDKGAETYPMVRAMHQQVGPGCVG